MPNFNYLTEITDKPKKRKTKVRHEEMYTPQELEAKKNPYVEAPPAPIEIDGKAITYKDLGRIPTDYGVIDYNAPAATLAKHGTRDLAAKIDAKRAEVADAVHNRMFWINAPMVESPEECKNRIAAYFARCEITGELPTVENLALALGVNTRRFLDMCAGSGCGMLVASDCDRARSVIQGIQSELVLMGKIPTVPWIFVSKNYYGMKDEAANVTVNINAQDSKEAITRWAIDAGFADEE